MCVCELNENNATIPVLSDMLRKHAEETISDEQVKRVLSPIIERINAGEFARPKHKKNFRIYLTQIIESEVMEVTIVMFERF